MPTRRSVAATAHAELTAIVESTHDAIIGLTAHGIVSSWNPAATRLYGYAPEEMIGFPANVLYPPDRRCEEAEILRRAADGEQVRQHRTQRRRKDGAVIAVSVTALPVADATGDIVSAATVSREPGDQPGGHDQRLENLGQLADGLAPDFDSLVAAILSYVSFASEQLAAATESDWALCCQSAGRDLGQIRRAGERAASLTRWLLAFARQEVIQPQVLDLDTVITAVADMLRRIIGEHVVLVTSPAGGLWPVLADRSQLEQVLVNLAVNARDAMADGGTLTIDTANITVDDDYVAGGSRSRQEKNVRLRVSDTGSGMTREVADHAFEPRCTTTEQGAGTGLGLATVYQIVTQNGGSIQICSRPGTGTTFTIMLPVTASC